MYDGSHSRSSYPFDKMLPYRGHWRDENFLTVRRWYGSTVNKWMHRKKQRQHNTNVVREEIREASR